MQYVEFVPEGTKDCTVRAWIHSTNNSKEMVQRLHPAVIICPGGAYCMVSDIEAEPVAEPYFAAGYNVFILKYAIGEKAKDFGPLIQLAATIGQIRKRAVEWHTDKEKIAVCGFSAGGHLACSLGTLYNEPAFMAAFGREDNIRPNAMILCYPVITSGRFAHTNSIQNVSGAKIGSERYQWFGLDKHVDEYTPPTFLWHTADDESVPVENSLAFAAALSSAKVPFELHVFPHGKHGMSVCTRQVNAESAYNARWMQLSIQWLDTLFCHIK